MKERKEGRTERREGGREERRKEGKTEERKELSHLLHEVHSVYYPIELSKKQINGRRPIYHAMKSTLYSNKSLMSEAWN
jgi:hypothetical protein